MCLRQIILPFQGLQAHSQQPAGYRCSRRSGRRRRLRTWCSLPGITHSCSPKQPCCCWSRPRHIWLQCQCPVLCATLRTLKTSTQAIVNSKARSVTGIQECRALWLGTEERQDYGAGQSLTGGDQEGHSRAGKQFTKGGRWESRSLRGCSWGCCVWPHRLCPA